MSSKKIHELEERLNNARTNMEEGYANIALHDESQGEKGSGIRSSPQEGRKRGVGRNDPQTAGRTPLGEGSQGARRQVARVAESQEKMILSATGHRPDKLGGYGKSVFDALVWQAQMALAEIKPSSVISGMALGWDQAFAQAAINANIPFVAAVPFSGQEGKWPSASQDTYKIILSKAQQVVIVSRGGYAAYKMQVRNCWLVDNSDAVLALWNGTAGGTANCIAYAKSQNKRIINIWDRFRGTSS